MDIKLLQDLAGKEVEAMLACAETDEQQKLERRKIQKKLIDKVRKNLWTLTCQGDVVEMTGVLDDFGGDKDVEGSISRAIFGLLCFGAIHGVQVPQRLEKLVTDLSAKHKLPASADEKPKTDKAEEKPRDQQAKGNADASAALAGGSKVADVAGAQKPSESVPSAKDEATGSGTGAGDHTAGEKSSGSNSKEEKVKLHEQALRGAKSVKDLDRIWKHEVGTDKSLEGKDKVPLFKVYKECRKLLETAA